VIAYKFLRRHGVAPFTGERWPLPENGGPGRWIDASGDLAPCENGLHLCRAADLPYWLDEQLWAVEVDDDTAALPHHLLARRARVTRPIAAWTIEAARDYGLACMVRGRDLAAGALRAVQLDEDADRLASSSSPQDVSDAGRAASATAAGRGHPLAARLAYAAATAGWHMTFPLTEASYVAYPAFSAYAACVCADGLRPADGYDAERGRQAAWLAERLDLT
jgi:hypothetical protein